MCLLAIMGQSKVGIRVVTHAQCSGQPLTRVAVAKRLSICVEDLPDAGLPWTDRDVLELQRERPEWLAAARKSLAAARSEQEGLRRERTAAVAARQATFSYPPVLEASKTFARESAQARLLEYLHAALDSPAADTDVVDAGYDVSTYARRADEANRDRAQRGLSLSGCDGAGDGQYGKRRPAGSLGDLLDARTGDTTATYVSGFGLSAETWDEAWHDRWSLEGLDLAHVLTQLVLTGDTDTLEAIAGIPLADVVVPCPEPVFDDVDERVCSLAREALHARRKRECPVLDPEDIVDMDSPIWALPQLLLACRQDWDPTERLAALIAGLD
ncbi:MAG: hypothetical protein QOC69_3391 [Mycobacterium sp.]|jgi:hypothetical protein|nr:hypothetical protein [Mycobacterium sp.]